MCLALLTLTTCVGCSGDGPSSVTGTDASCSKAGIAAQPEIQRAVTALPGAGSPVWHNASCTSADGPDVPSAVLEVPFTDNLAAIGSRLEAAGCMLKEGKKATWTCPLGAVTYAVAAHQAEQLADDSARLVTDLENATHQLRRHVAAFTTT